MLCIEYKHAIIFLIIINLGQSQVIYEIVDKEIIIDADYTITNNQLSKSVSIGTTIYECGYGFWFRYSLNYPQNIIKDDLSFDLGGLYFKSNNGNF
jgi:hypothetical protein